MNAIFHLIRKEFLQVLRDRPMLGIIFVMPMIQLFVLGYAINTDIKNIRMTICDWDKSPSSRGLIDRFSHSPRFIILENPKSASEMQVAFDRGETTLTLVIQKGFEENIRKGVASELQIMIDGVDSNSALIAAGYTRTIIMNHFRFELQLPFSDPVRVRAMYNPSLESRLTIIPGIVAFLITLVTVLLTALGLVREREIGTLEQLNVTPIRPLQLILGKVLPFAILGGVAFTIAMTFASLWFKIPMQGSYGILALFTGIYLLTTLGLGMFVSTVTSTQQQAVFFAWFILVTSILMSGFMYPISNMPDIMQKFTLLIPLRYYITVLRDIMLKGSGIADLKFELEMLLIFGVGIFTSSVLNFRKRL
jgi:ABC-2 type transport system permease protein